ncbi:hypothetical protein AB6A40_005754 [Gnathostoma spinigerum]|uniref:CHMP7 winged helix domain-containing protein n=1 Tax=Gnathostoma spinigerum TaxID=75299 RepID=A0ABD6EHI5_9BILA
MNKRLAAKEYFPEYWNDDSRMCGLMSMLKAREVNPYDYDRKVKFWSETISKSCIVERDPILCLDRLKQRFRRGDQLPSSLDVILENMLKNGEICKLDDFRDRDKSWMQWSYSRLISSFWTSSSGPEVIEYVHLPTVQKQAQELLDYYHQEYAPDDDMLPEIVAMDDFRAQCHHIVPTSRAFELALSELIHRGELTVGRSSDGEQILKFRDGLSGGPIKWTQSDASLHDLRRTMSKIEGEVKKLEMKVKKADADARACVRSGDKVKAMHHLRLKKRAMKEIEDKDNQYERLLGMLYQLGQTKQNKQVMDAYKAGADAFKATLQRHGITPDSVDETMDNITDALMTAEEINEALHDAGGIRKTDNTEFEEELNAILAEKKEEEEELINGLPAIPTDELREEASEVTDKSLSRRLQRLRQSAT